MTIPAPTPEQIEQLERVAVLGAGGQLGSDLVAEFTRLGIDTAGFTREALDVTDRGELEHQLGKGRFTHVINCAALTNVDRCEAEGEAAYSVNTIGAYLPAAVCAATNTHYTLISTDFVFDGEKGSPYVEDDTPNPLNIYGASKLAGEQGARIANPQSLILRISSVFGPRGSRGKGGNFVETILARALAGDPLRVVDDIAMAPTFTLHVARALPHLLAPQPRGIVHLTNSGSCTWYEFADEILNQANAPRNLERIRSSELNQPARRPAYSVLATKRLEELVGFQLPSWQVALQEYLAVTGRTHLKEQQ